jgi:Uma2 family endonuclease
MATAPQPQTALLTAEEFARRPDPGYPEELIKGRIVPMPQPGVRHGKVCARTSFLLQYHLMVHDNGHVVSNDSGVITERGPDTVRGADVAYYSSAKFPRHLPLPAGYADVPPDLVFEVLSSHDRWPKVLAKVVEYLEAGVAVVAVLDPEHRNLHLYEGDRPARILGETDELTLPALLGDFRVVVGRFFD